MLAAFKWESFKLLKRPAVWVTIGILLLLAVGWAFVALGSVRFVLLAGPLLAMALLPAIPTRRAVPLGPGRVPWIGAAVVVAILLIGGAIQILPARQTNEAAARYPVAAVERLIAGGCTDRILNAYDWGGYLAFRWGQPVGAYGSSPGDVVATDAALESLAADPAPFLDAHGVAIALVKGDGPLDRWLRLASGWRSAARDPLAALYVRATGVTCLG